jgi:hypothetical protein
MGQVFYHCATAALYYCLKNIYSLPLLVFSGRFCSPGSRIFRSYLVVTCLDFPAVSVVTCLDFLALPFLAPEGWNFPAVSVVSGREFPAVAFLAWVI